MDPVNYFGANPMIEPSQKYIEEWVLTIDSIVYNNQDISFSADKVKSLVQTRLDPLYHA